MNSLRSNWHNMRRAIGTTNAIYYLVNQVITKISARLSLQRYHLVAQPLANKISIGSRRGKKITVKEIEAGDVVLQRFPRPQSEIDRRFVSGAVCLCAFKDDELTGYLWFTQHACLELPQPCEVTPGPGAVWDFDCYIFPDYRLSPAFAKLWEKAETRMRESGAQWSLSRISAFNSASMASHRRLGMKILKTLTFFSFGKVRIMFANLPPYFHLAWRDDQLPRLRLNPPTAVRQESRADRNSSSI